MRESRTAPVAQKFEAKPATFTRKGLTSLLSFPRGMECIDPLGLGIIDNRTLRLITERSASEPSKSEKDIDNNLREKLLYLSDKFDAKLFLSRIHQVTSAADLEAGALALKTDLKGRTQQRKQLVKDNFDCFVSCKTTIDDIESKLRRIEEDPEGSGTSHLYNSMQGVSSLAVRAFEPLFERQAQAEKIRSVQGMLQRFRTLFNLPSTIRSSLSKGEYDLAVREYKKAKSVALPSHVSILKRVLEEVEKVMHEFKGTLYKSMEDPQIELTNLENTVRLLLELEPESDPVWHYLSVQNNRIRGLLEKCSMDHEARMEMLYNEMKQRALLDAKWRQIQNETSDVDPVDVQSLVLTGEEVDALRGKHIRRLTAVIVHHVPAFWKVALSVFSGKFAKSSQVSVESKLTATSNKADERVVDVRSTHSLDEVAGMIQSTIKAYGGKVHTTFHDLEESNILCSYMSDAIKEISKACKAFEVKESAPPTAALALKSLQADITKIYILRLCTWMRATTAEMSKDETWTLVSILERNKSPYTISFLPLAFRSVVASAMDQINLLIQSLKSEAGKSEDIIAQVQEIQLSIRLAFFNCFLDFAGHLEHIGTELVQNKSNLQNGYIHEVEEKSSSSLPGTVVNAHQKLLIVLSNIGYCKDELSHELFKKYKCIWLQPRQI
ncbi:Exocyst complex component SEC5A [Linum grandiflorum]